MPDDIDSDKILDWAWDQAVLISGPKGLETTGVDPKLLEKIQSGDRDWQIFSLLLEKAFADTNSMPSTFTIFIRILANSSGNIVTDEQIENFQSLFEKTDDAVKFVKVFLRNVHAKTRLELLFEIQPPKDCPSEALELMHELSKYPELMADNNYRNKFKKIVQWSKEIYNYLEYLKSSQRAKALEELISLKESELEADDPKVKDKKIKKINQKLQAANQLVKPTKIENLINWYHDKAREAFNSIHNLAEAEAKFLFDWNVGPDEIEGFKGLKNLKADSPKDINSYDKYLPNIVVANDDYFICKLSDDDIRGPFLGLLTGCCQHLGGVGHEAAKYGYISHNACFYVMFKGKPPPERPIDTKKLMKDRTLVAQCLAWRNPYQYPSDASIVFDSIEMDDSAGTSPESKKRQNTVKTLFFELAKNIVESSNGEIQRVMVGTGGELSIGRPCEIPLTINTPADLKYTDAKHQNLAYSTRFKELPKYFCGDATMKLDEKAALNECKYNAISPSEILFEGISSGSIKAIEFAMGADPNAIRATDKEGYTPLMLASSLSSEEPAIINAIFNKLRTSYIIKKDLIEIIMAKNKHGQNVLMHAAMYGYHKSMRIIFDRLKEDHISKERLIDILKEKDDHGITALMYAAKNSDHPYCINLIFAALRQTEASKEEVLKIINAKDDKGRTALAHATLSGMPENVKQYMNTLIDLNISKDELLKVINNHDNNGATALMVINNTNADCYIPIIEAFDKLGCKKDGLLNILISKNSAGKTTFMHAIQSMLNIKAFFNILTETGISKQEALELINATDENGKTALMYAATLPSRGNIEGIFEFLDKAGADAGEKLAVLNAADKVGKTALDYASNEGTIETRNYIPNILKQFSFSLRPDPAKQKKGP